MLHYSSKQLFNLYLYRKATDNNIISAKCIYTA